MAKSTTTTKAKTNTTKKKTAVKSATKTTKATTSKSKKPVAKAAAKTTSSAKTTKATKSATASKAASTRLSLFKRPQILIAGLYAALAVAAGLLMNTASAQVLLGHLAKDELASRAGTVLAPAATSLYEVEFRWLLVALLVAAAVIAVLRGTRYKALEDAGIKARVQPLRWVEFAVTGAIAFEIAALLNGLQDAMALKLSMLSIVLAALLAWLFERENAATGKPTKSIYVASALAAALPVVALLVTMYGTYVYGMERSPWYAYAAAAVVSLGLLVTVRSVRNAFKTHNGAHDYVFVDRNYNRISVVTKVALAVVLIVGLYAN